MSALPSRPLLVVDQFRDKQIRSVFKKAWRKRQTVLLPFAVLLIVVCAVGLELLKSWTGQNTTNVSSMGVAGAAAVFVTTFAFRNSRDQIAASLVDAASAKIVSTGAIVVGEGGARFEPVRRRRQERPAVDLSGEWTISTPWRWTLVGVYRDGVLVHVLATDRRPDDLRAVLA